MDISDKVLDVFKTLIRELNDHDDKVCIPYDEVLNMDKLTLGECEYIDTFLEKINTHSKKITNKDESVIDEELLMDVDLKKIWNSGISEIDKNNIWKYLQTFCIITINLNSSKELQQLLSGETKEIDKDNRKDLKDLKKIKKIKQNIDEIKRDNYELSLREVEEEEKRKNQMPNMDMMSGIFQNTGIGQLAKEIAEGMDIQSMMGESGDGEPNMENVMKNMMDPSNFMNMFQNINSKVQEKMQSGELSEQSLSQEAEIMYGNFADNPMFKNMMNNPDLQEQVDKLQPSTSNKTKRVEKKVVPEPKIVPKNKTQERLQKKLAAKNEKNIKVDEVKQSEKVGKVNVKKTD